MLSLSDCVRIAYYVDCALAVCLRSFFVAATIPSVRQLALAGCVSGSELPMGGNSDNQIEWRWANPNHVTAPAPRAIKNSNSLLAGGALEVEGVIFQFA